MIMDSSDEFDDESEKSNPGLNMSHGFIHHIRRNQIDRDNYDKRVKSEPRQNNRRSKGNKKPESKLYTPPSRSEPSKIDDDDEEVEEEVKNVSTSQRNGGKPLFMLEYTAADGTVHPIMVRRGQDASKIARRLANQAAIPKDLLETLKWKIEQEQTKRS